MPGGSQETKTQSVAKPYPGSRPLINTVLRDAGRAYNQGMGSQPYTGSTVIPMSRQTERSYSGIMGVANKNANGPKGLTNNLQDIIKQGGFNDNQMDALAGFRRTANSHYNPNANPGYQSVRQNVLDDTQDAVNLNAATAGRFGSGIHEGVLSRELGKTASNMDMNDFNTWLGRKDAAQGNLFNAAQAGIGNMTNAYQGALQPYQSMAGVGAGYEDLAKRTKDDQLRVFNETQNAPWKQFGNLLNVANLGGQYNNSQTTSTAPGQNPFLSALGGVSVGAGLLGNLGIL